MKKHDILKHLPLETDRLILRTFALEDAAMTKAAMDARAEDLRKWMSWSSEEGMSVNAINGFIQSGLHADNTLDIPLVAVDKGTGAFVLSTGIHAKDDDFRTISVGWWIAKDAEGKGLAYEAMSALLDFSFETVGANLIETQYYEGNHRSKSLIERLGFSHFNTVANGHTSHLDGGLMNVHEYKRLCGVSSSGISIRRWNEYDWEVFKAIRMEAVTGYSHVFLNNAETTMSYADDHWKGMLRDTYNDAIFGLYDGDTVIGLTGAFRWRDSPSDTVILGMSYVRESYRGRHLSDLFYQARLDWAWAQDGITRVIVSHKEGNEASKSANQRWGFQPYGTASETYGDGSVAINYKYELRRDLT